MKKQTEIQARLAALRQIRSNIETSLDDLETFGQQNGFQAYEPEMFVNDETQIATMTWGISVSIGDAVRLQELFNDTYQYPRLVVEFLGNVNLADEAVILND